jgi:hypothetical protein
MVKRLNLTPALKMKTNFAVILIKLITKKSNEYSTRQELFVILASTSLPGGTAAGFAFQCSSHTCFNFNFKKY